MRVALGIAWLMAAVFTTPCVAASYPTTRTVDPERAVPRFKSQADTHAQRSLDRAPLSPTRSSLA